MVSGSGLRSILLISLVCIALPSAASLPEEQIVTYSFVHISDPQSLTTHHPATLNLTFSQIEAQKKIHNISAIIITGDLVNNWNDPNDWDTYRLARNLTTIPVYEIAGNHDTEQGNHYQNYSLTTGKPGENYVTSIGDFDFLGINYVNGTLSPRELSPLHQSLSTSPRSNTIIATHYYMDEYGTLSPLGKDIDTSLIVKPSLVLMGHMHANFIKQRAVGGFPTVADMTNYQDGVPGGTTGLNYSAGILYTVRSVNGRVETMTARALHIYPDPSTGEEMTVFVRDADSSLPARTPLTGTAASVQSASLCSTGDLFCTLNSFFRQGWTDILHLFS